MLLQLLRDFPHIVRLRVSDIEHGRLNRSQPCRHGTGMLLDEDADETLKAADDGTVQHHGAMAIAVFAHVFRIQALGHGEVDLDGAALPLATDGVLERVLDLGTVERAIAGRDHVLAARSLQAVDQRGLRLVPAFIGADARLGARGNL